MAFKIGDVVVLKSTGPMMTIIALPHGGDDQYRAMWFGKVVDMPLYAEFPAEALRLLPDQK